MQKSPVGDFCITFSSVLIIILTDHDNNSTYANSLDPDEMSSNLASHPDPCYLTFRQHFYQLWETLKHFDDWSRQEIKQTNNLFGGQRVKLHIRRWHQNEGL